LNLAEQKKIAIGAALEREVRPLVRKWKRVESSHAGHALTFFESEHAVAVCAGIGQDAARRAAEAIVTAYHPELLLSAGFAGALDRNLKVGQVFWPGCVIDGKDNSTTEIAAGNGTLISFPAVAGAGQKAKLADAYGAQAVDMEAAAIARGAQKHGIEFAAVKVISDERDFDLPPMDRFVNAAGQFRSGAFAWFAVMRPWLWPSVLRLARNSARASQALSAELERFIASRSGNFEIAKDSRGLT
jgi:adenosylhomocysteine nucleosidase